MSSQAEDDLQEAHAAPEDTTRPIQENQGLIDNPFAHWSPEEVDEIVHGFAEEHSLQNQENLLLKAGKILRDPEAWRSVPGLMGEEKYALELETRNGFWRQPKALRVTIITLCVAAVVQGWNQTASNGANLNWPQQLGLTHLTGCDPSGPDAWKFAIVNAATYLSAGLIGCWLSDPLNEYFYGRRAAICVSASLILAASIGCACTQTWQQLLGCRVLLGIGMGSKASVVPVFAAEVSPAHIRGSLVMNWQIFDALGIFLGFTANLSVSQVGRTAWRWQTATSVLPTIVLLSLIFVCPESPRFLMKRGRHRYPSAYRTLILLRGEPILAAKELLYIHFQMYAETGRLLQQQANAEGGGESPAQLELESKHTGIQIRRMWPQSQSINYWQKLAQLFTKKNLRRATICAVVPMISQQLCGVNVLAFYSSTFFCDAGKQVGGSQTAQSNESDIQPLFLSWGIGLSNFIFAFPAYWLIDRLGRRWLLLITIPFLALSMLAAGLSFLIPFNDSAHAPVVGLFTYIFMFFYSWGMGPVPFTLSAEVFPLEHRVVGMSFAVFANLFGAGLLTLFVPALTNAIGHAGLLGIFAGLNVVSFVLVFFFVRETAGAALGVATGSMTFMSLEELGYIFGVPTMKHAMYQLTNVLPWAWRYYVKRDPECPPRPEKLYTWATARDQRRSQNAAEMRRTD